MPPHLRTATAFGFSTLLSGVAGVAVAGCNCVKPAPAPPPPPPMVNCCNVPTTHQVIVPGVQISAPQINVSTPVLNVSEANASAAANANAGAVAETNVNVSSVNAVAITNAANSAAVYSVGGGSNYSVESGGNSFIPALSVEGPPAPPASAPICVSFSSLIKAVAIQAECLDDKAVPHPASQVSPDRDVADAYEGEVYRCIAGARMQYTLAEFSGRADFNHGQTVVCQKGEALYHTAQGRLQCRPQRAARDCNERSLLRRFGAGIKVLKLSRAAVCTRYEGGAQTAAAGSDGAIALDGGVGGVVR